MHDAAAHDPHSHGHDDHGGVAKYVYVFLALCVLTAASFMTYFDAWPFPDEAARLFMLAISCTKALLVMLFFMHLKYEADWKYVLTIPASIMSILLILALVPDIGLRTRSYTEQRTLRAASPGAVEALVSAEHEEESHDPADAHDAAPAH